MMYAALEWCTQNYSTFIDRAARALRRRRVPDAADISVTGDQELARQFDAYFQTPQGGAVERMKLFKLAWDLVGSEFAGRHLQYEKFYAGASFIVRKPRLPGDPLERVPRPRRRPDVHLRHSPERMT
jgi:4-hydroxyphenylacetate 3-monooxygenase